MFRRKQDVDRHVSSILGRIKDERERNAKGYQIARLYFEVREYEIARRYLASFLTTRETVPQAYRLLGEIEEAIGNKQNAVEAYKRCLEHGGAAKEVVLKICELYTSIGVDPGKGKYWMEKAEQLYPHNEIVFKLKEKILSSTQRPDNDEELENLISAELVRKPHDVQLRIKLLQLYLKSGRVDEAYLNALETDRTTAFNNVLDWYECLLEVFKTYQEEKQGTQDIVFIFHYLIVLGNLTYLRLCHKDTVESAEALHSFDLAMQAALTFDSPNVEWDAFITEMQGQLFFLAGTLLLKKAQKGSFSWADVRPLTAIFYLVCQTIPTVDAQATWFVRPPPEREKIYAWLYKNSFFRISQTGHTLYHLCQGDPSTWAQKLQQQHCTRMGQERAYEMLFTIRTMRERSGESYLLNTSKYCNTSLCMPPRSQMLDVDRVAHTFHPENLSEITWLCLQQYSFGDPSQPDYNFKIFETLQYSVKNMENGAAETLCTLDTEAFLYASVRCAALHLKEHQLSVDRELACPSMLPLCLCKKLCTPEQEQWWQTAYSFYTDTIRDSFTKMRHILQRGLEVVRLLGNHGMSASMVVHLAKTFDGKRRPCRARMNREELIKSLKEGSHGNQGSASQLASLEARAAFYWGHALNMLIRLERNQKGPTPKMRLFDDGGDDDLATAGIQELLQEAKFASSVLAMKEGRYEEALEGFQKLMTPWASFYKAQIFKTLAQQELERPGAQAVKQEKYAALIEKARDALYTTMDYLSGKPCHELNVLLTREIDDVESKMYSFDQESNGYIGERSEVSSTAQLYTPQRHQNGHHDDEIFQNHSTPRSARVNRSVRQRLIMSESVSEGPVHNQRMATSSPSHTRPSPERLDAQIKSINYSQTHLFKMVLDRNEELVIMYRGIVEELQESNSQLRKTLSDNHELMEQLKTALADNKCLMSTIEKEMTDTKDIVKQIKEEYIAKVAAASSANPSLLGAPGLASPHMAPGYLMASAYQQAQYPYGQPPPHLAPPGTGYPYPFFPGYPPPRPPYAASRLSDQPGGTAPSSFGKFRGEETTEDEEEDDENGLLAYGSEYSGEGLLQTPYCMQSEVQFVHDLVQNHQAATGVPPVAFVSQTQPHIPPPMPQPGFFASALRGQALQYTQSGAASNSNTHPLTIPGPGFFSSPSTTAVSQSQSAIVTALGTKSGITNGSPQPVAVLGAATGKSGQSVSTGNKTTDLGGIAVVFSDVAKLTTLGCETPMVDVKVIQNTSTKQGSIVATKKDTRDVILSHTLATIRVITSFNPDYFIWSLPSQNQEKKMDDTFRLGFDTADQSKKMRTAVEQVMKSMGIKPAQTVSTTPPFGTKPVTTTATGKPVSTPTSSSTVPSSSKMAGQKATTVSPNATTPSSTTVFGGFTFSSTPVVKSGQESKEEKPKASPKFHLKESSIKVTSPTAKVPPALTTSDSTIKPFAGFTFTPSKPLTSTFGSTPTTTSSQASTQAFTFGANTNISFSSLSSASQPTEVNKSKPGSISFQASQSSFQQLSPLKSPGGGKDDEAVEDYEPNVDFKPVIELPELIQVKTGEEDEVKIFGDRVKLFRFDSNLNQWKERGLGELKILKSKGKLRFRILMRREQVLKVCANHYISGEMKLTPLSSSDRAWCYTAQDFAEEEMKIEKLAVKFKNTDKAKEFKSVFEDCCKQLVEAGLKAPVTSAPPSSSVKVTPATPAATDKMSLSEMFRPKEGSWECSGCLVMNSAATWRCPACQTLKPEDVKQVNTQSLSEMFKPKEGSWECSGCLIQNSAFVQKCPACQTLKPGLKLEDIKSAVSSISGTSSTSSSGGFGGFKFGGTTEADKPGTGSGFKFGVQPGSVPTGFKVGSGGPESGTADSGFKFVVPASKNIQGPSAGSTGFKFLLPEVSGFKFGTTSSSTSVATTGCGFGGVSTIAATTTQTSTVTSTTSTSSGFIFPNQSGDKDGSGSLLKQLLMTEDKTSTDQSAKGFAFNSSVQSSSSAEQTKSGPGWMSSFPTPSSESFKASGFQARLGQVTSPTIQAGSERKETGFQFTFSMTPQTQYQKAQQLATSPKSPDADDNGHYLNKDGEDSHIFFEPVVPLPEKVEVKTGEEEEIPLFENRAKLYRFVEGEWKEKGRGVFKILEHRENGRTRVLMRRDQVLKICCNHYISMDLDMKPMARSDGKAWIWYAMDFSEGEGKMEQLAVRFRDVETANKFKVMFDKSKEKITTPNKTSAVSVQPNGVASSTAEGASRKLFTEQDDDVIFDHEEKPTADQIERARKLLLPDTFYLYENRPGCPGCIGCEDYDPCRSPALEHQKSPQIRTAAEISQTKTVEKNTNNSVGEDLFGRAADALSFSALAASSSSTLFNSGRDSNKPFHFMGAGQKLFDAGSPGGGGDAGGEEGEDGSVPPSDDIHFEPLIPLPELVQVKTGEEEWEPLFVQRAKLYRFDSNQWKERGIGEMKLMKHKEKLAFRVLMRREQVLKVACNHMITPLMELRPMTTSETSWCWIANDFTENEPRTEQFAVKFKNVELAKEFKSKFEDCQEKLRKGELHAPVQETVTLTSQQGTDNHDSTITSEQYTEENENSYYSQLNVEAPGIITGSIQAIMDEQGSEHFMQSVDTVSGPRGSQYYSPQEETITQSEQSITGDRGNLMYSAELDVNAEDRLCASEQLFTGDRGNPYYSRQLDFGAKDAHTDTDDRENDFFQELNVGAEDAVTSQRHCLTGDKGNPYYTTELNVGAEDLVTSSSTSEHTETFYTQEQNVGAEDSVTESFQTASGDSESQYYSQEVNFGADDISGSGNQFYQVVDTSIQDETVSSTENQISGRGRNPVFSQLLDPADNDGHDLAVDSNTYHIETFDTCKNSQSNTVNILQKTPREDKINISQQNLMLETKPKLVQTQLEDRSLEMRIDLVQTDPVPHLLTYMRAKGNIASAKQLDSLQDSILHHSQIPLGDKGNFATTKQQLDVSSQDTLTQQYQTAHGDEGSISNGKKLDILSQDTMTKQYDFYETALGYKGNTAYAKQLDISSEDKGNIANAKQLDESPLDTMTKQYQTPLGDKGNIAYAKQLDESPQDIVTNQYQTPLGDKGNIAYAKQLDVSSQDIMTEQYQTPLGDKGNIAYAKQLDESPLDTMTKQYQTPLGNKGNIAYAKQLDESPRDTVTNQYQTPLGDKGNIAYAKQLDVSSQDTMTEQYQTPLGDKGNIANAKQLDVSSQDIMTEQYQTPLGDKGNIANAKQLDESPLDTVTKQYKTPLGDKGNIAYAKQLDESPRDTVTNQYQTPLGDKGNIAYAKQLDVSSQDTMTEQYQTPLGDKGNIAYAKQLDESPLDTMTKQYKTPLGDKGNIAYAKQLDVSSQDIMTNQYQTPLGDKGNIAYAKQLDESPRDSVTNQYQTPLGDKGNIAYAKQLDVSSQDTMTEQYQTPLGHKGNIAYAKQLDESPLDTMTKQYKTPLGDKGNIAYAKQLDVSSQDIMTNQYQTPLGDKGNIAYAKQLDVSSQDIMTNQYQTPLGDKGNITYAKQLDVSSQDSITKQYQTLLGDKGNIAYVKELDVTSQDTMAQKYQTLLGVRDDIAYNKLFDMLSEDTMVEQSHTLFEDKGNIAYAQQQNMPSKDVMSVQNTMSMTQDTQTQFVDKGNIAYKTPDVSFHNVMTQQSHMPAGHKVIIVSTKQLTIPSYNTMIQHSHTLFGDKCDVSMPISQSMSTDSPGRTLNIQTHCSGPSKRVFSRQPVVVQQSTVAQPKQTSPATNSNTCSSVFTKWADVTSLGTTTQEFPALLEVKQNENKQNSAVSDRKTRDQARLGYICNSSYNGERHNHVQDISQLDIKQFSTETSNFSSFQPPIWLGLGDQVVKPFSQQINTISTNSTLESMYHLPCTSSDNTQIIQPHHTAGMPYTSSDNTQIIQSHHTAGMQYTSSDNRQKIQPHHTAGMGRNCRKKPVLTFFPSRMEFGNEDLDHYDDESHDVEEDEDEEEEEEEGTEEEEEQRVEFEKRVTLHEYKDEQWEKLGLGHLRVLYNQDLESNSVDFVTDSNQQICNHIICRETSISVDSSSKSCEWQPLDFVTNEPIRRHFKAVFSSEPAAKEFANIFRQGQQLAAENEISEKLSEEIDVPEVFSAGDQASLS